eukprot:CAMPEP_0172077214 /NCGR_PEP_ID=MMETSP1043-20130122/16934_1 /TAXON_ID=464988 /ORGANISM="Hemiselmis andersenii, Strain CCMP441" /LENGTH=418 /DNA_ID=CAMNT_0012738143 /DNA_START=92 /DNA_END=1348 /DNA_ORIENTATION=-
MGGGGSGGTESDEGGRGIFLRWFRGGGSSTSRWRGKSGAGVEEGTRPPNPEDAPPGFVRASCGHCGVLLQAPTGVPVVQCGACGGVNKILITYYEDSTRTHDGYLNPGCCLSRLTSCFPEKSFFYFALLLTVYIIGTGFVFVAPLALPSISTPKGLFLWGFAVYLSVTVAYNYYMGANTDPGAPPSAGEVGETKGSDGQESMCEKCQAPKPPRTHHCSACGRCVVGMDHHCVFLNNCVGDRNIAYFMRFLLWVAFACAFVFANSVTVAKAEMARKDVRLDHVVNFAFRKAGTVGAFGYIPQMFVMHNIIVFVQSFAESCGPGIVGLLVATLLTAVCVSCLLVFHLALAWFGKTQLQYSFLMDPGDSKKRWAGIRGAFGEHFVAHGAGFLDRNWWWISALGPFPASRLRAVARPPGKAH